jgi:hypothetical protein
VAGGRLRRRADELAAQIDQGNTNLIVLPPDRLPGVVAKLRPLEREREAVQAELRRAGTCSSCQDLEQQIAAAERMLWQLREALQAEEVPLLREILRKALDRVELTWEHRQAGKVTRTSFAGGVLSLRTTPEPSLLSPAAGR